MKSDLVPLTETWCHITSRGIMLPDYAEQLSCTINSGMKVAVFVAVSYTALVKTHGCVCVCRKKQQRLSAFYYTIFVHNSVADSLLLQV